MHCNSPIATPTTEYTCILQDVNGDEIQLHSPFYMEIYMYIVVYRFYTKSISVPSSSVRESLRMMKLNTVYFWLRGLNQLLSIQYIHEFLLSMVLTILWYRIFIELINCQIWAYIYL